MTQLPHWQYITQGKTADEHLLFATIATEMGCPWIQLRMKNFTDDVFLDTALKIKEVCKRNNALLFINDKVEIAAQIQADGVHLGKNDMLPSVAKTLLHKNCLIGGTANTWEDVQKLQTEKVDYIGLGPFRFTNTKKNLSPILGLKGYEKILSKMKQYRNNIPIFAIGGIRLEDLEDLKTTGVHGIAVSGLIAKAPNAQVMVDVILEKLATWKN